MGCQPTSGLTISIASVDLEWAIVAVKIDRDPATCGIDPDFPRQSLLRVFHHFALFIEKLDLLDRKYRTWTIEPDRIVCMTAARKTTGPDREAAPAASHVHFLHFSRLTDLYVR